MGNNHKSRKVLIITQYFPPDITAAAFRLGELRKFLIDKGFKVDVLTSQPHKTVLEDSNKDYKDDGIFRIKISSKRHISQYIQFVLKGKKLVRKLGRYDYVLVSSPPMFVFSIAKAAKAKKILLDIRDIWPDSAVGAGKLRNSLLYKYFKKKELKMYLDSDQIFCVSKPMAKYITAASGKNPVVIYNGIPKRDLEKIHEFKLIRNYKNDGIFRIGYFGNVGLAQGMELLPESIKIASEELGLNISFEIVGAGVKIEKLKELARKYGVSEKFKFMKSMNREDVLRYSIEKFDALFINLASSPVFEKTIPSKIFDYLLVGKPVISGIKGEGKMILESTGACVSFQQDSPESLAEAIKLTIQNYDNLSKNALKNMRKVAATYTREDSFEKVARVLEEYGN